MITRRCVTLAITAAIALAGCNKKPPIEDMVDDAAGDAAADAIADSPRISQVEDDLEQLKREVDNQRATISSLRADIEDLRSKQNSHELIGH